MRDLCPRTILYTLFGIIALVLSACIVPIDINHLDLKPGSNPGGDPGGDPGTGGSLGVGSSTDYEHPQDVPPDMLPHLIHDWTKPFTLSIAGKGDPKEVYLIVINPEAYETIEWYINDDAEPQDIKTLYPELYPDLHEKHIVFPVKAGIEPFKNVGLYQVTVLGIIKGVPYSNDNHDEMGLYIEIVD
jgi:hypothetical protein